MRKLYEAHDATFGRDRDAFLHDMMRYTVSLSAQSSVTVYFDGKPGDFPATSLKRGQLEVRFTFDEEADDAIIAFVRNAQRPKELTIVSDDRRVIAGCKEYGAAIERSSDFAVRLARLKPGASPKVVSPDAKLDGKKAADVTKELFAYYAERYKQA
jgi:hypothetical protein